MEIGERIIQRRKELGYTQAKLAEEIGVSVEAISKWEQGKYGPGHENYALLDEVLGLSWLDEDSSRGDGRFFDEDHMAAFLKRRFSDGRFPESKKALDFAKKMHKGQFRKGPGEVPFINHPLNMACHALAMGLEDDALLAALLLHDVSEDCSVAPEDLPVCPEAREIVRLVTKVKKNFSEERYYRAIEQNPKACMVKCIDRCHNVSCMAMGFTDEQIRDYIEETETYFPKLIQVLKAIQEYNNAAWLLTYQMRSVIRAAKGDYNGREDLSGTAS